jgi:hypothetical protein
MFSVDSAFANAVQEQSRPGQSTRAAHEFKDESNFFERIRNIKIEKNDLSQVAKTRCRVEVEGLQGVGGSKMVNHSQLYASGSLHASKLHNKQYLQFLGNSSAETKHDLYQYTCPQTSMDSKHTRYISHLDLHTMVNTESQNHSKVINEFNYSETQKKLIRHQELNPHLYKRGATKYQTSNQTSLNSKAKGHWTAEEDKILKKAVQENGGKNWKKIAESLKGRTDVQCLHRWQKVLNPDLVKGPWTDIEDRLLLHLVNIDGPKHWTVIANHLPGRIGKQCRERWHNHLNPMIKRSVQWTSEEEWILFLLNRDEGNKWADIANILEGRTDNTIKNHWNSTMKKRVKDYQEEFAIMFKHLLHQKKMNYLGCDSVQTNEKGSPLGKSKYPKDYVKVMKTLE